MVKKCRLLESLGAMEESEVEKSSLRLSESGLVQTRTIFSNCNGGDQAKEPQENVCRGVQGWLVAFVMRQL